MNILVHKVLQGNSQAVRELYRQLKPILYRYIYSKVSKTDDVEELVQDSFLHLIDALPLFRFESKISTFAISIANHEVGDYYRKLYAKKAIKLIPLITEVPVIDSYLTTKKLLSQEIKQVCSKLQPLQSKILIWKYYDELSLKQIAAKLNITEKSAELKLYRAKKAFKQLYVSVG